MLGGELVNVLTQQMCIAFRRDVLKHYKKCYTTCPPEGIHDFVSEYRHDNININVMHNGYSSRHRLPEFIYSFLHHTHRHSSPHFSLMAESHMTCLNI